MAAIGVYPVYRKTAYMKTILLWVIAILLSANVYTQQSPDSSKWILKFAPLALIDPLTATIQPGIEYKFTPRWSLEADYGLRFRALELASFNKDVNHYRYNKFRLEGRWYYGFRRKSFATTLPYFIAAEAFFINQQYGKNKNYFSPRNDTITIDFDSAGLRRTVSGLCFKVGVQSHFKRDSKLFMEWAIGIGVRTINIQYNNVVNQRTSSFKYRREFDWRVGDNFIGKESTVHLALNIKLAYSLR